MSEPEAASDFERLPFGDPAVPWLLGLAQTAHLFIFRPREAFVRTRHDSRLDRAIVFGIVMLAVGVIVGEITSNIAIRIGSAIAPEIFFPLSLPFGGTGPASAVFLAITRIQFQILARVLTLVFCTAILHFALVMFSGAQRGIRTTIRTVGYSNVAALGMVIPIPGVSAVWFLVLLVLGLHMVQNIPVRRAILAVLVPVLLVLTCFAGIAYVLYEGLKGL